MTQAVAASKPSRWRIALGLLFLLIAHAGAALVLWENEVSALDWAAFLLFWAFLNFVWIFLLRRPAPAAVMSLAMIWVLVMLSQFKFAAFSMTVSATDVLMIDPDTVQYLWTMFPDLGTQLAIIGGITLVLLLVFFIVDPFRVRARTSLAGLLVCAAALTGLAFAVPLDREEEHRDENFVSKFARSTVVTLVELGAHGLFEADARADIPLNAEVDGRCPEPAQLPHIIMILDESGFDATMMPGTKVHSNYQAQFRSFDGKQRRLFVEGVGGPSWMTEYNVLSGLSVRSYGRFGQIVPRLAQGHVHRGLPLALRECGYRTHSIYPVNGAFLSARNYHTTTGFDRFYDSMDLGVQKGLATYKRQMDAFYYDFALRRLKEEHDKGPAFFFVYTTANHTPWNFRFREDAFPNWQPTGNRDDIDEFLRRQTMSTLQYRWLLDRLRKEFPEDKFLVVRFGDHQPLFARHFIDPSLDETAISQRVQAFDPRFLTTYYAFDAINFTPANLASALDPLDAPYLPIAIMEAAGLPLDSSFAEQKRILERCGGLFYACAGGAEARRFNRMLIDAGLIKGL